jgi:predicted permease
VLRQTPQLGRLIQPADNVQVGGHPVVVISDGFWRSHFQASPAVVGSQMTINGAGFTIIGVAERGFFGTVVSVGHPDVWIPFMMQPAVRYASNASNTNGDSAKPWPPQGEISWLNVFVRVPRGTAPAGIASGISLVLQQEAIRLLPSDADESFRRQVRDTRAVLESASGGVSTLRRDTSTPLLVLLAMVGVLLAIACGNVAGLLLSRAASREREVGIRLSIGASRWRIFRQLLAESLLLGCGAGLVGLTLAVWLHEPLLRLIVPRATSVDLETGVDWRVLSFVAGVSVLTGIACGVVPALRGTRVPITESLKQQARGSVGSSRRGMLAGRALVAAQMAFCLLLLVVAGLFARSLQSVAGINVGFDQQHVLTAGLDVRGGGYSADERLALYQRLIERMQRIPGVESVSLSANGPLANSAWRSGMTVARRSTTKPWPRASSPARARWGSGGATTTRLTRTRSPSSAWSRTRAT